MKKKAMAKTMVPVKAKRAMVTMMKRPLVPMTKRKLIPTPKRKLILTPKRRRMTKKMVVMSPKVMRAKTTVPPNS